MRQKRPTHQTDTRRSSPTYSMPSVLVLPVWFLYAVIAQLEEQLTCNQQVVGSNPIGGSKKIKREVVGVASHLTDKQKKKIIADYVTLGTYSAVARKHKVSVDTVKRVVLRDPETAKKANEKKDKNTADILKYMESQRDSVCNIIVLYLQALQDPEKIKKSSAQALATALGIVIDKFTGTSLSAEEQKARIAILKEKAGQGERDLSQFETIAKAAGGRFETKPAAEEAEQWGK